MATQTMRNYAALKLAANRIKNEVEDGHNTADRVGGTILDIVEAANEDISELKDSQGGTMFYVESDETFNDF